MKHKPVVSGGVTFTDVEARRWLIYWYLWSAQSEVSFDIRTSDNDAYCWRLKLTSSIPWLPLLNGLILFHCACASMLQELLTSPVLDALVQATDMCVRGPG